MCHIWVSHSDTLSLSKDDLFASIVKVLLFLYGKIKVRVPWNVSSSFKISSVIISIFPWLQTFLAQNNIPWHFLNIDVFLFSWPLPVPWQPWSSARNFSVQIREVELRAGGRCQFSRGLEKFSKQFFRPLPLSSYFNHLLLYTIWIVFSNRSLIFSTPV